VAAVVQTSALVGAADLYEICADRLGDVCAVRQALFGWLWEHPERIDSAL
jgi:hypothetical protein